MTCNWMKYVINSKVALSEVSFGIIINCVTVFSWKQFRKEQIQFSIFFFFLFCFVLVESLKVGIPVVAQW